MIEDISERLLREFAGCLQESLAREPVGGEAAPAGEDAGAPSEATKSRPPQPGPPPRAAPPQQAAPVEGLSLVGSVLWGRVRRNAVPILATLAGFLLALLALRRSRN